MVDATVKVFGRLDCAVNNAALTPDDKPAAEFDEAYWDRLMSIDLKGTGLYFCSCGGACSSTAARSSPWMIWYQRFVFASKSSGLCPG